MLHANKNECWVLVVENVTKDALTFCGPTFCGVVQVVAIIICNRTYCQSVFGIFVCTDRQQQAWCRFQNQPHPFPSMAQSVCNDGPKHWTHPADQHQALIMWCTTQQPQNRFPPGWQLQKCSVCHHTFPRLVDYYTGSSRDQYKLLSDWFIQSYLDLARKMVCQDASSAPFRMNICITLQQGKQDPWNFNCSTMIRFPVEQKSYRNMHTFMYKPPTLEIIWTHGLQVSGGRVFEISWTVVLDEVDAWKICPLQNHILSEIFCKLCVVSSLDILRSLSKHHRTNQPIKLKKAGCITKRVGSDLLQIK